MQFDKQINGKLITQRIFTQQLLHSSNKIWEGQGRVYLHYLQLNYCLASSLILLKKG